RASPGRSASPSRHSISPSGSFSPRWIAPWKSCSPPRSIRPLGAPGPAPSVQPDTFWDRAAEPRPREQIEELQIASVRACVARLRASGVEFYRQRLGGLSPDHLRSIEDLARLPFTTKNDLRDHYPFGLFAVPARDVARIHASSGSTG